MSWFNVSIYDRCPLHTCLCACTYVLTTKSFTNSLIVFASELYLYIPCWCVFKTNIDCNIYDAPPFVHMYMCMYTRTYDNCEHVSVHVYAHVRQLQNRRWMSLLCVCTHVCTTIPTLTIDVFYVHAFVYVYVCTYVRQSSIAKSMIDLPLQIRW